MAKKQSLILVTNDDGVKSPGLLAAVEGLMDLGEILVVAPREQQSSAARAFYARSNAARKYTLSIKGVPLRAIGVDASPAVSVRYGLMIASRRKPDLLVSGINYGENLASGLTISGTVGAALEGAAAGVPSLAVSLETDKQYHTSHSRRVKFEGAAHFTRAFAERILAAGLPQGASVLNVNIPREATPDTPWRVTRASTQAYFRSVVHRARFTGYDVDVDVDGLEPDSDIYAVYVDHVVSVTPLSFDLTAHVSRRALEKQLRQATAEKRTGKVGRLDGR